MLGPDPVTFGRPVVTGFGTLGQPAELARGTDLSDRKRWRGRRSRSGPSTRRGLGRAPPGPGVPWKFGCPTRSGQPTGVRIGSPRSRSYSVRRSAPSARRASACHYKNSTRGARRQDQQKERSASLGGADWRTGRTWRAVQRKDWRKTKLQSVSHSCTVFQSPRARAALRMASISFRRLIVALLTS